MLGGWILGELVGWFIVMFEGWRELRRHDLGDFMGADVRSIEVRHPGLWRFAIVTNVSLSVRMASKEIDDLVVGISSRSMRSGSIGSPSNSPSCSALSTTRSLNRSTPDLSRYAAAAEWANFRAAFLGGMRVAALVVIPGWLVLVFGGRWLISITSGPEFADAHGALIFYALGVSIAAVCHGLSSLPMAVNRPMIPSTR